MADASSLFTEVLHFELNESMMSIRRILVVDDDSDTVELLKHILYHAGFDVISANSGVEALALLNEVQPDAILLDLMMPELDGKETLTRIRSASMAPVIIVSALSNKETIVELLNLGSDDYVTKPFNREEIIARINAVIRRATMKPVIDGISIPEFGLVIDVSKREVVYHGVRVQLSPKEFVLLDLLARNIPKVVTYDEISEEIWGTADSKLKNRIKYLVHLIRRKFSEINDEIDLIITVEQLGYRLRTEQ